MHELCIVYPEEFLLPEQPTTRSRKLPGPGFTADEYWKWDRDELKHNPISHTVDCSGTQITVSEGHQWPAPKGAGLTDRGGAFYTSKSFIESGSFSFAKLLNYDGPFTYHYTGPVVVAYPRQSFNGPPVYPPNAVSNNSALDSLGATAIARCEPTNSVADVSTFLGELMKDGLPSLVSSSNWRNQTARARSAQAGDEYLNVQFGWMPLVRDVSSISNAIRHSHRILSQYERDAGRVVRRRYNFPIVRSVEETLISASSYPMRGETFVGLRNGTLGTIVRRRETTIRRWFSGAFTYHLPTGYDSRNRLARLAARADVLAGTKLTPETLWNIGPWSWAVDWFANTGDIIHNLTAFKTNGLVMRYGYMMEESIVRDTYTHKVNTPIAGVTPHVSPVTLCTITKVRRPANPFGFGLSWNGLSPFQLSIAAALGISRGR
jgi:hypothetical protein